MNPPQHVRPTLEISSYEAAPPSIQLGGPAEYAWATRQLRVAEVCVPCDRVVPTEGAQPYARQFDGWLVVHCPPALAALEHPEIPMAEWLGVPELGGLVLLCRHGPSDRPTAWSVRFCLPNTLQKLQNATP